MAWESEDDEFDYTGYYETTYPEEQCDGCGEWVPATDLAEDDLEGWLCSYCHILTEDDYDTDASE